MSQLRVVLNGLTYTIDTDAALDQFVVSDASGTPLNVSSEIAAQLYGAGKAWKYLELVLNSDVLSQQTTNWHQVEFYAAEALGLQYVAGFLGNTEGLLLRQLVGAPVAPAAVIKSVADLLKGSGPDAVLLAAASIGITDAIKVLNAAAAQFQNIAPATRSGVAIDFDALKSLADRVYIAESDGQLMANFVSNEQLTGSLASDVRGWVSSVISGFTADFDTRAARAAFTPQLVDLANSVSEAATEIQAVQRVEQLLDELSMLLTGAASGFSLLTRDGLNMSSATISGNPIVNSGVAKNGSIFEFGASSHSYFPDLSSTIDGGFLASSGGDYSTPSQRHNTYLIDIFDKAAHHLGTIDFQLLDGNVRQLSTIQLVDGNLVVVYRGYRVVDGHGQDYVAFARINTSGNLIGSLHELASDPFVLNGVGVPTAIAVEPKVTLLSNGDFVASWVEAYPGATNFKVQVFHPDGTAVGTATSLPGDEGNSGVAHSVATSADGSFAIAWSGGMGTSYIAFFTSAGTLSNKLDLPNSSYTSAVSIAALAGGGFVASWESTDSRVYAEILDKSGRVLGPVINVASNAAPSDRAFRGVDVVKLADGGFVIAYTTTGPGGSAVAVRRYDAAGQALGVAVTVSPPEDANGAIYPAILQLHDGDLVVAWHNGTGTFDGIGNEQGVLLRLNDVGGLQILSGGTGDDLYRVDNPGNVIFENFGAGIDTVSATVDFALPGNVENLTLVGSTGLHGTGNALDNLLSVDARGNSSRSNGALVGDFLDGGGGADTLIGGPNADTLDGGAGLDKLHGGVGNDMYHVDQQGDLVFENAGEGTDGVIATSNFYLYANIEDLTLAAGAGNIFGVGNELANLINGNEGNNTLLGGDGGDEVHAGAGVDIVYGEGGGDTLYGDAGNDFLAGGDGDDVVDGGAGGDSLYGEDGNDTLTGGTDFVFDQLVGGNGNDILHGDSGQADYDYLYGNAGDDSFYVDTGDDLTFEQVGEGIDTVYATVPGANNGVYLYANVENLVLLGATSFGVGNVLANTMTGNASGNYLLGGDGNDRLNGKAGNDVLFGQAGADTFVFEHGTGGDVVGDFMPGTDKIDLSAIGYSWAQVQNSIHENGGNTAIDLGGGDLIVLNGVTAAQLGQSDFILAGSGSMSEVAPTIAISAGAPDISSEWGSRLELESLDHTDHRWLSPHWESLIPTLMPCV